MFDITKAEKEAREELAKERSEVAKTKIKEKLRQIERSRQVTANLELEYAALLRDIGAA